jgi:hypothetical protein
MVFWVYYFKIGQNGPRKTEAKQMKENNSGNTLLERPRMDVISVRTRIPARRSNFMPELELELLRNTSVFAARTLMKRFSH